ncbi:MAG: hypothetical protein F6K03_06270 [Kamptonema sp. SIO4C4]|nr:hypothetical protein [Kamptonema sp. SIO4C4]
MTVDTSPTPSTPTLDLPPDAPSDEFLSQLLRQSEQQKVNIHTEISGWLQELRQRSAYDVTKQRMPNRKDEEWRFTDISELLGLKFQLPPSEEVTQDAIAPLILPEAAQSHIVFVNGIYAPNLSDTSGLPEGVYAGNLSHLPLDNCYEAVKYIAYQDGDKELFTALNSTGFPDVAVLWANPNVVVETPIQILFITTVEDQPSFSQPRGND